MDLGESGAGWEGMGGTEGDRGNFSGDIIYEKIINKQIIKLQTLFWDSRQSFNHNLRKSK